MLVKVQRAGFLFACVIAVGCTTLLGVDEDYTPLGTSQASGASGDGGSGASGGTGGGGGGVGGSGAANVDAAVDGSGGAPPECSDQRPCGTGKKCCFDRCFLPEPIVGCSMDNCDPCDEAPPENADPSCNGDRCSFACVAGYVPVGGRCQADGSGGTAGVGGGSGGASGTGGVSGQGGTGGAPPCVVSQCPGCIPHGPFGCCKADKTCGCTWAPTAICY